MEDGNEEDCSAILTSHECNCFAHPEHVHSNNVQVERSVLSDLSVSSILNIKFLGHPLLRQSGSEEP